MTTSGVTLRARLDRVPTEEQALAIARAWAELDYLTLGMTSTHRDEPWIGITGQISPVEGLDQVTQLDLAVGELRRVLAESGFTVAEWDCIELLSAGEVNRRLRSATIPPMVSAQELADLCGVTRARIYELEGERRDAAERGERHAFPTPVVPGYWLKTMAEHYASTRKRRPGPAPSRPNPLLQNRRAAGRPEHDG